MDRKFIRSDKKRYSNEEKLALAKLVKSCKEEYDAEVQRNQGKTKYDSKRKRHVPIKPTTGYVAKVVISIPIMRTDKEAAGQMVESLNRKLKSLDLNIIDNNNITAKDLGRRGLHLNNRGISKFAGNILDKLHDI